MNSQQWKTFNHMCQYIDKHSEKENKMQKTYVCGSQPAVGDKVATIKGLPIGAVVAHTLSTITILPFDHEMEQYTDDISVYRLTAREPMTKCSGCNHDTHNGKCHRLVSLGPGIKGVKPCGCYSGARDK